MRYNNKNRLSAVRHCLLALAANLLVVSVVHAGALQIDEPWQTSGANTGNVDGAALSAVSAGDKWDPILRNNDVTLYSRADLWGTNALPVGTIGDFLGLDFGPNQTDVLTITLNDELIDPIFYIGDFDVIGTSVSVPDGGSNFFSNADGQWNGNTLLTINAGEGRAGSFGSVRYLGTFPAGKEFVFEIDYDVGGFSRDLIGVGIGVIPIPSAALLFGSALGLLGWIRHRF